MRSATDGLGYIMAPLSKNFWTTTLPATPGKIATLAKDFFTAWSKAGTAISHAIFKFVFPYHPFSQGETANKPKEKSVNSKVENKEVNQNLVDSVKMTANNIVQFAISEYRKEQNPVVVQQEVLEGPPDIHQFMTKNGKTLGKNIVVPFINSTSNNIGGLSKGLLTTVLIQKFLFEDKIEIDPSEITYYTSMGLIGEVLVPVTDFSINMITDEIPLLKIPAYFFPTRFLYLALVTHPEIRKTIEEQPFVKPFIDGVKPIVNGCTQLIKSGSDQVGNVTAKTRSVMENAIVFFINEAVETGVNQLFTIDGKQQSVISKIEEQGQKFEDDLNSTWSGMLTLSAIKQATKNGEIIGHEIGKVKTSVTKFAVHEAINIVGYAGKQGLKATVLATIIHSSLKNYPITTAGMFILKGGTEQSTGELLMRVGTISTITIGKYLPWYISTPMQIATVVTITGGPGSTFTEGCVRASLVAGTFLTGYLTGNEVVGTIAMVAMTFFLGTRQEALKGQKIEETSFVEDTIDFVKNPSKKLDNFRKGVEKQKIKLFNSEKPTTEDSTPTEKTSAKTTSWIGMFWSAVVEFTEEVYGMNESADENVKFEDVTEKEKID